MATSSYQLVASCCWREGRVWVPCTWPAPGVLLQLEEASGTRARCCPWKEAGRAVQVRCASCSLCQQGCGMRVACSQKKQNQRYSLLELLVSQTGPLKSSRRGWKEREGESEAYSPQESEHKTRGERSSDQTRSGSCECCS